MLIRRIIVGLSAIGFIFTVASCSAVDDYNNERGRGDAGIASRDDSPVEILNFPDGFKNVANKCDGHGHRVFVSSIKGDSVVPPVVIADPSCNASGH